MQEEVDEQTQPAEKKFPVGRIAIMAIIAIIILGVSVIIGLNLGERTGSTELPTFTATVTKTPTITPSPTLLPTTTPTQILPTATPQPPETYTIQEGDTPSGIAEKYGLTTTELLSYNDLDETDFIVVGQKLLIPPGTPTPGPSPTLRPGESTATPSPYILHTVVAGDSLLAIAEKYGTTISTIKTANDIPENSDAIRLGQVLTVPLYTPTPESAPDMVFTTTPTPGVMTYKAPLLLYPPNKAQYTGKDIPISLQWSSVGILNNRESYNVEVIISTENEKTTYNVYTRSTAWRLPDDWIPEDVPQLNCSWRVHVVRQVTESVDANFKLISTTIARRTFTWILSE